MLPSVQVFKFEESLGHSVWYDYHSNARTIDGLTRRMKSLVKDGTYIGYRFIHVYFEALGNVKEPSENELREPFIPQKD